MSGEASTSSSSLYTGSNASVKDPKQWPTIIPGGSLLLAWQLNARRVLIVGGGNVAADRLRSVLPTGAKVTLICPEAGLGDEAKYRVMQEGEQWGLDWRKREFQDSDVEEEDWDMVLTALDDPVLSKHIHSLCKKRHFNVNVADVPPLCDFYFGSVIRRGPLQVMISTNGKGPRLANRIRRGIEDSLPSNVGDAIENIGELRKSLRKKSPGSDAEAVKKRMEWMVRVTDSWTLDELAALSQEEREAILAGFEDDYASSQTTIAKAYWRRAACPYWLLQAINPLSWIQGVSGEEIQHRRESCPVYQAKKDMRSSSSLGASIAIYSGTLGLLLGASTVLGYQYIKLRR